MFWRFTVCRCRNSAMMIASPTAASAAATVITRNTNTWPPTPYACANAVVDGWAVRTNNPPCGAMRGFGVVQACFAHESQMDKLAAACGLDPVEIRLRNAMRTGDPGFYALLNQGKASVVLDFDEPADRQALTALIAGSDVVIEASRPRALQQIGIGQF